MNTPQKIRSALTSAFSVQHLHIEDESILHSGHSEAKKQNGGHFKITIVSDVFAGQPLVKRHRMIYKALESEFKGGIHALGIKAYTPLEWKNI